MQRFPAVAGQLTVRWARPDGTPVMWLSGTLDQATVALLDHELDGRTIDMMGLVIDLTGLGFVDPAGLDALVGIHWRASTRGDRLSFRHGRCVAQQPVELTRDVRRRSRWVTPTPGVSDENLYFPFATTSVDVDHPPSDDRPEAA